MFVWVCINLSNAIKLIFAIVLCAHKENNSQYDIKNLHFNYNHIIRNFPVDGQPRAIYSWVSNTERSSYYSLSVEGHTFYRLNYPLRLNRWYHTCQSWNGKTGEWQIWVNAERVGRGFHNRVSELNFKRLSIVAGRRQKKYLWEASSLIFQMVCLPKWSSLFVCGRAGKKKEISRNVFYLEATWIKYVNFFISKPLHVKYWHGIRF